MTSEFFVLTLGFLLMSNIEIIDGTFKKTYINIYVQQAQAGHGGGHGDHYGYGGDNYGYGGHDEGYGHGGGYYPSGYADSYSHDHGHSHGYGDFPKYEESDDKSKGKTKKKFSFNLKKKKSNNGAGKDGRNGDLKNRRR